MAILSALLSVSEPSNSFWIAIIRAFEAVTNNYVLAIIFLTVVIRIIWSVVDIFGKHSQRKMTKMQERMKPELEKLKVKYASQPQVLSQKQNELNRKYMDRSYYVGCFITLIVMVLNMVIFFTLFAGLNTMSAYKISVNYDNLKTNYANCIRVVDNYLDDNSTDVNQVYDKFVNYQNLAFIVNESEQQKTISLVEYQTDEGGNYILDEGGNRLYTTLHIEEYLEFEEFASSETQVVEGEEQTVEIPANQNIVTIIERIFPTYSEGETEGSKEIIISQTPALDENGQVITDENGEIVYNNLYLSTAVQNVAMRHIETEYEDTKESFLWIENIWIADSPTSQSIQSFSSLRGSLGKYIQDGQEENEEKIYNAFMLDLRESKGRANGYYILPILIVLVSVLTIVINNLLAKRKSKLQGMDRAQTGAMKWMQIIIPILLGIFALFYNSVFAVYMLTGQIISAIIAPLQNLILDKIDQKKQQKKEKEVEVDYRRKF